MFHRLDEAVVKNKKLLLLTRVVALARRQLHATVITGLS